MPAPLLPTRFCSFQTCLFCYEKIKEQYTGSCPACRTPYGVDPEDFKRQQVRREGWAGKGEGGGVHRCCWPWGQ